MSWTLDTQNGNKLSIKNGKLALATADDAVIISVKTRLGIELGEWVYDTKKGLDYYGAEGIYSGEMSMELISALVRQQVLTVDGVERINSFSTSLYAGAERVRKISMNIKISKDDGASVNRDTEFGG